MFRSQYPCQSLADATTVMQAMQPLVRSLFGQVEQLIRLLLVCPVSSCEAERSFSCLRRLKTWLRNSMSQQRLNAVAVCHVHQQYLDQVDVKALAGEFVLRSQIRMSTFGSFTQS